MPTKLSNRLPATYIPSQREDHQQPEKEEDKQQQQQQQQVHRVETALLAFWTRLKFLL